VLADPPGTAGEVTTVVAVTTDEGISGYGEAAANPNGVVAMVEHAGHELGGWDDGFRDLLVGRDPTDPTTLWNTLKSSTFWSSRAGVGHVALAGIDTALWDIAGKAAGVPSWRLMGDRRNEHLVPYITLYHGEAPYEQTVDLTLGALVQAREAGYRAAKVETLPHNTPGGEREGVELVRRARELVGDDFTLLLDLGYRWANFVEAESWARKVDDLVLFALEAPFHTEQLDDYRQLREAIKTPIATGDELTAGVEYLPLLDSGAVDIVQCGAARTGVSDMHKVAQAAHEKGRLLVPWGWTATTVAVAANLHFAVVHDNVPLIEYAPPALYPDSPLRSDLFGPEPAVRDGEFVLPESPGLGVEIDSGVLDRLRVR
jgi:L-alanine-DL-glutamate epimerase-like enolase superfamily enzyme